jgi:DNA-binding MarR family transcriptional regulator
LSVREQLPSATEPQPGSREAVLLDVGKAFKAASVSMRRLRGRETHRPGQLSYAQFGLLFGLASGSEMSARELADIAALTQGTVHQMLEGLEASGLVERTRSDTDKRVVLTRLTERGQAVVAERRAALEPAWRAALADFSDEELRSAGAVLTALATHFDRLD